jgi:very-short-patch-repair endonuclease
MNSVHQNFLLQTICNDLARKADTVVMLEYRFHTVRRWRFDAAFPERKIGVEIDGGVFIQGRHTTGVGFRNDCAKINAAGVLGWRVFRFLPQQIESGEVYDTLGRALEIDEFCRGDGAQS